MDCLKTELFELHKQLGAKLAPFAGFEMPIHYTSIVQEHEAVRNHVGLFDVSHMGRISIEGEEAEAFLNYLCTNKIEGKVIGTATYTVLCNEKGGCVDDVIVYRLSEASFFIVANASNCEKDLIHIQNHAKDFSVRVQEHFLTEGIFALQGPKAINLITKIFPSVSEMKPMQVIKEEYNGASIFLATTGYTGEKGVEILAPNEVLASLWEELFQKGKEYNLQPVGLGARDTLRLEMGFALYGHELDDEISPTESVSAWTVKMNKENFLGKEALLSLEAGGDKRAAFAVLLEDKGVPREGYSVLQGEKEVGVVTSGTFSPSLKQGIALVLGSPTLQVGEVVEIQIRKTKAKGKVVSLPFYKRTKV